MTKNIIWLRQSPSGAWATPFVLPAKLTREVPKQLRSQLELYPHSEIHLPYLERKQTLPDVSQLQLLSDIPGRAFLVPPNAGPDYLTRYQIMLAIAAAVHEVKLPPFCLAAEDGTVLEGRESIAWLKPPIERQRHYFRVCRAVSRAFQLHLRNRFTAAYFSDMERFRDTEKAWPVLLFAASRPFEGKLRSALTYEVLDHQSVDKFYRSATRGLPRVLAAVQERLVANGYADIARAYSPARTQNIVQSVQRDRNPMRSLLLSQSLLFEVFFRFVNKVHGLADSQRTLRTAPAVAAKFVFELRSHLRRFYNNIPMSELALPLFLCATHAMFEARSVLE